MKSFSTLVRICTSNPERNRFVFVVLVRWANHSFLPRTQMARLPLNTLPAFREVAKQLNLRAAADTLHLTHSAVSQQIRVLEEQLGFPVFERRGRRVLLNPAGEVLYASVQSALAQLDDAVQTAAATAAGTAHSLRITVLPS